MIYLRWLGSNPGGFIEIKRELTLWRAKQQPKFGLSERKRGGLQRWGLQEGGDRAEQGMLCPQRVDAVRLCPTPQLHRACAKFLLLPSVTGAGNRPGE